MSLRKEKLADQIRDILGGCFSGGRMNDPRLQFVSITAVKLSGDLQIASVYFRTFDEKNDLKTIETGLKSASGFLRKKLADEIEIRRVPEIRFFFDESVEYGSKIEGLLAKIR